MGFELNMVLFINRNPHTILINGMLKNHSPLPSWDQAHWWVTQEVYWVNPLKVQVWLDSAHPMVPQMQTFQHLVKLHMIMPQVVIHLEKRWWTSHFNEAPDSNDPHQVAIFVIMWSEGIVRKMAAYLWSIKMLHISCTIWQARQTTQVRSVL